MCTYSRLDRLCFGGNTMIRLFEVKAGRAVFFSILLAAQIILVRHAFAAPQGRGPIPPYKINGAEPNEPTRVAIAQEISRAAGFLKVDNPLKRCYADGIVCLTAMKDFQKIYDEELQKVRVQVTSCAQNLKEIERLSSSEHKGINSSTLQKIKQISNTFSFEGPPNPNGAAGIK